MTLEDIKRFTKNAKNIQNDVKNSRASALKLLYGTGMYKLNKGDLKLKKQFK